MEAVYLLLIRWDIPIYFVGTLTCIFGLVQLIRSQSLLRRAVFGLERERGLELRYSGLTWTLIPTLAIGLVLYVNLQVAPTLPAELLSPPTPTPNVFATPFASPTPVSVQVDNNDRPLVPPDLAPTATLLADAATPAVIATPPIAPVDVEIIPEAGGCTPAVNIRTPRQDEVAFGTVQFLGTATDINFGSYTLELRGSDTGDEWINILGRPAFTSVENDALGSVNVTTLPDGDYNARLSVYDLAGNLVNRCIIDIQIANE